ncbi:MAG: xanthine dehydrogenase family protein molybdopterin-binding subunit [Acidobacteria bacterium]|nr:MAG: xanthine dehydrogenase family protein molybdopterin-binding subunit [Acidobacteriota bacterium]REK03882.1 MAG: xanthine dehydrogenase family protein molybdopterin-binding subunit [Acidobacteriota bacterium]
MSGKIGSAIKRREDPALITGRGRYTDDLKLPGMLHAAIVRSPHAHARIRGIDIAAAKASPGVHGVFTAEDVNAAGLPGMVPVGWLLPELKTPPHPILASEKVNHVGDAVAVVVADERYQARDAADLVEVDYEPLPASSNPKKTTEGAQQIHDEAPNNIAFDWEIGDRAKTDAAFAAAAHTVEVDLTNNRLIPFAIEPRAVIADYDGDRGAITVHMTTQNPHVHRLLMCLASLGFPEHKVRVVAPEVGGGFGSKIHHYADETIVCLCSIKLGRPVKWTATRTETNLTDAHGRDHVTHAELALDEGGKITGLRVETWANMGAYLSTFAPAVPTYLYGTLLSGQYDIPAIHAHVVGTFTNTCPVDAYRGAGRPEATFVVERLMHLAGEATGLGPAEIRRRNFVRPDAFPYETQVALTYDSGNYEPALDRALELVGYDALVAEQAERRKDRTRPQIGIGFSNFIEACGLAPSAVVGSLGAQAGQWESADVRVHPTGTVTVYTGSSSHGQGHETTFAQIVADKLGLEVDQVEVVHGDTDKVQFGMGTYGSRSAAVGGSAIARSVEKIVEKSKRIAAHLLEASAEDIDFAGGKFTVKGSPESSLGWADVTLQAYLAHNYPDDLEPGLSATTFYDPSNFTYPFGSHICVVEVDPETGNTRLLQYVAVDDVGNVINPMIVEGQVHGGLAQGIGQALWEGTAYDEQAQLLTGSLMDYALPKIHNLPMYTLDRTVTPCPHNPLGVKGVGEAGAIASPPAVVNAVLDALQPWGVRHLDMPLHAEKVWRATQA